MCDTLKKKRGESAVNPFLENYINCATLNDMVLYYCGKREKSLDHRYGPHRFDTYLLTYVVEGTADFYIDGKRQTVSAGEFYAMFPHSTVHYTTKPGVPWTILWIVVGGEQVASFLSSLQITETQPSIKVNQPDKLRQILESLFEYSNRKGTSDKLRCLSLVYRLFALLAEQAEPVTHNPYVLQAMDYFSEHFCEPLSIQAYAAALGLNNNYFSKLFKAETGITPLRYLNRLRFEKAQDLLAHSALSVDEIAGQVGIADTLYFSRAFKQYTGVSPTSYRKLTSV